MNILHKHNPYIASDFLKKEKKDHMHTCPMCSWVFKVIKEKITMFELHEMFNIFQKIILVQYVHEFLSCLPKYHTCAMCSWVFKVIKEKITMLVQFVHEFLHVCLKITLGREWYTFYEPKKCGLSIFLCSKAFTTLRAKYLATLAFKYCTKPGFKS